MKPNRLIISLITVLPMVGCQSLPGQTNKNGTATTAITTQTSYEDIADAVVWQHPENESHYLIATLEGDGVAIYNQNGKEVAQTEAIEPLAADLAYGVPSTRGAYDLLAFALEEDETIGFYTFDPKKTAMMSAAGDIKLDFAPSGVCLYKNPTTQATTVTAISEDGTVVQYKLSMQGSLVKSSVTNSFGEALPVREFNVGGELSACIVDSSEGTLYIAEQNVGIWAYGADVENVKERRLVDAVAPLGHLVEIEGLDLALQENGAGVLWVADEGAGLVAYSRSDDYEYLGAIDIEGFDEVKLVTVANNALWLGNTELDEPVYELASYDDLEKAFSVSQPLDASLSPRDLTVTGVTLVRTTDETDEVDDDGDAADDSAFWLNPDSPEDSLIIATNKQGGLMAYNLDGEELQYHEAGEPNNVDVRTIQTAKGPRVIAAASNRDLNTIAFYEIENKAGVDPITPLAVTGAYVNEDEPEAQTQLNEVYGFCMGQIDSETYAYVNGKSGTLEQWHVELNGDSINAKPVRTIAVPTQPEGCVVDDKTATLYLGEEDKGIWKFDASADGSADGELIIEIDGDILVADVEGLTLVNDNNQHWLLASSQGNNTYAAYDIAADYKLVGTFAIIENGEIDGASDTDGIELVTGYISDDYPNGIFIAQDWYNIDEQYQVENQNFKLVSWADIVKALQ